jgi:hypothetical protein
MSTSALAFADGNATYKLPNMITGAVVEANTEKTLFRVDVKELNVKALMHGLERQADVKILVSDDVDVLLKNVKIVDKGLDEVLPLVAQTANLVIGKIGNKTYLVVKQIANLPRATFVLPSRQVPQTFSIIPRIAPLPDKRPKIEIEPRDNTPKRAPMDGQFWLLGPQG